MRNERLVRRVRVEGVRRRARGREWYECEEEDGVKGGSREVEAMGCCRAENAILLKVDDESERERAAGGRKG